MKRVRFTIRQLALCAAFAAMAGAMEATLGAILHALGIPLTGMLMAGMLVLILLTGRTFVPRRGSLLLMGGATALVKLLSIGGRTLRPALAILVEALLLELVASLPGRPGRVRYCLAGAAALSWPILQTALRLLLISGGDGLAMLTGLAEKASRSLGWETQHLLWLIAPFLLLHWTLGATAGYAAWRAGRRARERMGASDWEEAT